MRVALNDRSPCLLFRDIITTPKMPSADSKPRPASQRPGQECRSSCRLKGSGLRGQDLEFRVQCVPSGDSLSKLGVLVALAISRLSDHAPSPCICSRIPGVAPFRTSSPCVTSVNMDFRRLISWLCMRDRSHFSGPRSPLRVGRGTDVSSLRWHDA